MSEDIDIAADRHEIDTGDEFHVSVAVRVLRRSDRVTGEISYVLAVDDSLSMSIRADAADNERADPDDPDDLSRKDLAEEGVRRLAAALPEDARVDLITFAREAGLRFSGTAGELRSLDGWDGTRGEEQGSTNIEDALRQAYTLLEQRQARSRRVVLLSDGWPNAGETDPERLAAIARKAADREVHTDAIGIGAGADYALLRGLAPTGITWHVSARATAPDLMKEISARFAAYGRDVVVGSGELSVEVNPHCQVLAVYQLDPIRHRLDGVVSDGAGIRPSEVRLELGAIAEGVDGQVRYVLRLRAPGRVSAGPMPIVRVTGRLGSGAGARQLRPRSLELPTVRNPMAQNIRPQYGWEVTAAELEREINDRAAAAGSRSEEERIYEEGVQRARDIPDPNLAAAFLQAVGGLHEGMQRKDVQNESRATSSSSSTRNKPTWFQEIPEQSPLEIQEKRRQRSLYDDDEDLSGFGAHGGGSYGYGSGSYDHPVGESDHDVGTGQGADDPTLPPHHGRRAP
ncbi:VWA domain-containing protein [Streptomyces sp. NPDC001668]|uniref:VWA domain-containing protein n=1 Tax=unclassified Streptomyces TaxID=2593676 RepID=UPI00367B6ACE